jgi:hypothetical protein
MSDSRPSALAELGRGRYPSFEESTDVPGIEEVKKSRKVLNGAGTYVEG